MAAERRAEEVQAQLEEQLQKLAAERARQGEQAALALMRQGQPPPPPEPEPEAGHSIAWAASKGTRVATNNVIALPPRARLLTLCYGAACRLHKPHKLRLVAEHTECASEPARRRRGATGRARALARG